MAFRIVDTLLTNLLQPLPNATVKAQPDSQPIATSESGGHFRFLEDPTRSTTTASDGTFTLPLSKPSESWPTTIKWNVILPPCADFPLGASLYGQVPEMDIDVSLYDLVNTYGFAFATRTSHIPIAIPGRQGDPGVRPFSPAGGSPPAGGQPSTDGMPGQIAYVENPGQPATWWGWGKNSGGVYEWAFLGTTS